MRSLVVCLTSLLLYACGQASDGPKLAVKLGQEFTLALGQEGEVEPEGLKVKFDSVSEDSRCPEGVTCIWQGNAKIRLRLAKAPDGERFVDLNTAGGHDPQTYPSAGTSLGYTVRLNGLSPKPGYAARLTVTTPGVGVSDAVGGQKPDQPGDGRASAAPQGSQGGGPGTSPPADVLKGPAWVIYGEEGERRVRLGVFRFAPEAGLPMGESGPQFKEKGLRLIYEAEGGQAVELKGSYEGGRLRYAGGDGRQTVEVSAQLFDQNVDATAGARRWPPYVLRGEIAFRDAAPSGGAQSPTRTVQFTAAPAP